MVLRRDLLTRLAATTALITVAGRSPAMASPTRDAAADWVARTDELTALFRGETLTVAEWRAGLEAFNAALPLEELLRDLNFERLRAQTPFAERGVSTARVDLGNQDVRELAFFPKVFAVNEGRAIIPHGHSNMVSAHLVAAGRFHLRQYDQIDRDERSLLVRPSFDGEVRAGDLSSIGEVEDNVHWFIALEPSYTLDVIVTGLDETASSHFNIFNLDMDAAQPDGALLRVPRLSVPEALAKYG